MNLTKLFETQAELDKHIIKEKGLQGQGQDLLDKKILALQVELGELANEWRGFKFWSEDQRPRTTSICNNCEGQGGWHKGSGFHPCEVCWGIGKHENPLLEEYVDCLHFILSIGNDLNCDIKNTNLLYELDDITHLFSELISTGNSFNSGSRFIKENYELWIGHFVSLGKKLGFTWQQIEDAYYSKNKINHERQTNGY